MRRTRIAALALVVGALLSACAHGATNEPGGTPVSSSAAQPEPSASPSPTPTPSDIENPTDKARGQGSTTITGTVTAGVEPNCMLLNGYLLIGGPRELFRDGAKVNVTGRPSPGLMTTCQQGTPFVVDSAQAG